MSLLPFLFDDDDYTPFGHVWPRFPREDFFWRPLRTWRPQLENQDVGARTVVNKDGFQVNINVSQFAPEEVDVKAVGNEIVVEGKHEEKQDEQGFISRHFVRRYVLPAGHDAESAISTLSSDGVLTVNVRKAQLPRETARSIPITHTGATHKALKEKPRPEKME